jgi:hypothetical protein
MGDGARDIIEQMVTLCPAALFEKNENNEYPIYIACMPPLKPNLLNLLLTLMSKYQTYARENCMVIGKYTANCDTLEHIIRNSNDENVWHYLDICWKHSDQCLMLHAASRCKVNLTFLRSIISRYEGCVMNKDVNGDLPLQFALKMPRRSFYWYCGLRDIVKADLSAVDIRDKGTGLMPFMLSATTAKDIDTTFQLLHISPHLLRLESGMIAGPRLINYTLSRKTKSGSKRYTDTYQQDQRAWGEHMYLM